MFYSCLESFSNVWKENASAGFYFSHHSLLSHLKSIPFLKRSVTNFYTFHNYVFSGSIFLDTLKAKTSVYWKIFFFFFNNFLNVKFLFCFHLENAIHKRALIMLSGSEFKDFLNFHTCVSSLSTPPHMLPI